jgi:3-dehydroquinate dehydratase/shikimate dehydrogenase
MSTSRLCETVTGQSMAELRAARDAATAGDMVELRLDGVVDLDVAAALHGRRCPAIVTCRPAWEGGRFTGSEEERHGILARALALGAEHVDVEWAALHVGHQPGFADLVQRDPARIVLSSHDFDGVPSTLDSRVRDMRACGAGVIKVAVTARQLTDTLPLLDIARDGNAVVIAMGDAGMASRLLASRFGSAWTYAGNAVAPGQIPASRMLDEFRFRAVGPRTRLFGVASSGAMHSLSPALHNAAFAAAGLDAVYVPLQTTAFEDFLQFASALGIEGASITIPFKGDALRAAASADDLTRQVGATNTLRRRDEAWDAINTDVDGFLAPLEPLFGRPLRGARAAVMGAGGSARAVIVALLSRGARVSVHARRPEQALEVTGALGAEIGSWPVPAGSWDLLVNCTPLGGGARRAESPLPGGPFTGALVYDLTYGPGESALLQEARDAGCATLDGLPMLIAQAERQFEWWTGQAPAPNVMREAGYGRVKGRDSHPSQATESRSHGVSL